MTSPTLDRIRNKLAVRTPVTIDDPLATQAAVALIVVPAPGDQLEALFIRRAEFPGDPWSGHMALPGGRWQAGDQDLLDTAIRETREETAVVLSRSDHLGPLDDFTPRTPTLPRVVVRPYVFVVPSKPSLTLSSECADSTWISLGALRDSRQEIELDVRGAKIKVPAFVIGPIIVWGLTERIVSPFIELAASLVG